MKNESGTLSIWVETDENADDEENNGDGVADVPHLREVHDHLLAELLRL